MAEVRAGHTDDDIADEAQSVRAASPAIAALVGDGKMNVIAYYYELASGKVTLLG